MPLDETQIFGLDESKNKWLTMTKEQILTAIMQAVNEGTIGDIDAGFITKIQEMNEQGVIQFWFGTMAEYAALEEKDENTLYLFTDDPTINDIEEAINEIDDQLNAIIAGDTPVSKANYATSAGTAASATNASYATSAASATRATSATSATKATQDSSGRNIVNTYATKDELDEKIQAMGNFDDHGDYPYLQAGGADVATKAKQDYLGNQIDETYATKEELDDKIQEIGDFNDHGDYPYLSVGNATNADNADKVNNLAITRDSSGVLKIGDVIIPQKRILWSGELDVNTSSTTTTLTLSENISDGDILEFELSMSYDRENSFVKVRIGELINGTNTHINIFRTGGNVSNGDYELASGMLDILVSGTQRNQIKITKLYRSFKSDVSVADPTATIYSISKIIE